MHIQTDTEADTDQSIDGAIKFFQVAADSVGTAERFHQTLRRDRKPDVTETSPAKLSEQALIRAARVCAVEPASEVEAPRHQGEPRLRNAGRGLRVT